MPHDGGAFYTTDTMESSRPHYASSWPPILHAAALWLKASGVYETTRSSSENIKHNKNGEFNNLNDNEDEDEMSISDNELNSVNIPPESSSNGNQGDTPEDRFHLLFGNLSLYWFISFILKPAVIRVGKHIYIASVPGRK